MSSITVELDAENDAYVREEAARLGITVAEVIRRAVEDSRCDSDTSQPSAFPLAGLVGILRDEPANDLSTRFKDVLYGDKSK